MVAWSDKTPPPNPILLAKAYEDLALEQDLWAGVRSIAECCLSDFFAAAATAVPVTVFCLV